MPTASTSTSAAAPSPTLYIKNLPSSVKKPELRSQLYSLFSTYGRVLDVVATRAPGMRGQAFVVYETSVVSSAAKRALEGFVFYGSEMRIDYSRGEKSKALLRRELGEEAVLEAELERSKTTLSRRVDEGGTKRGLFLNQPQAEEDEEEETRSKRIKLESPAADTAAVTAKNIPRTIEHNVIETLFGARDGFTTITSVKEEDESWTAQIAFDTKQNAEAAAAALHGVQLDPVYSLDLSVAQ